MGEAKHNKLGVQIDTKVTFISEWGVFRSRDVLKFVDVTDNGCVLFTRDGITPVRHEMTWTSLISSGVKERREQFWSVYIGVARCT